VNGIALHVDGEQLDLGAAKVRLRMQSPLFQPEFIRQSYSYPFTLPWTPTNARIFRHAERLANTENVVELETDVYLGGLFWRSGVLKYRRYRNGYDCDLLIPPDSIITTLGERMLPSIDLGVWDTETEVLDDEFANLDDRYTEKTLTIDDTNFVFAPIKNGLPIGDNHWYNGDANEVYVPDPVPEGYVNHYDGSVTYEWLYHDTVIDGVHFSLFTPLPFLRRVLEAVMSTVSTGFTSKLLDEPEFNRMVVVGNLMHLVGVTTNISGTPTSFYTVFREGAWTYTMMNVAKTLPDITMIEFLVAIQKRFNGRFIFGPGGCRFLTMNEVLASREMSDYTSLSIPDDDIDIPTLDGYKLSEVEDSADALGSDRDEALDYTIDATVDSYADLAGLSPTNGDVVRVLSSSTLYRYYSINGWTKIINYLPSVLQGNEQEQLDIGVALTRMYDGPDFVGGVRNWITPEVEMLMSDHDEDQAGIGLNPLKTVRLLFYRGMQDDSESDSYPLLTNGVQDWAGNTISGAEWTERIEGEGGIHELWYRGPLEVLNNAKRTQRSVRLPLADIIAFDFTKKVAIEGIHYLVDAVDVEFTVASVGIPRLDLVKV